MPATFGRMRRRHITIGSAMNVNTPPYATTSYTTIIYTVLRLYTTLPLPDTLPDSPPTTQNDKESDELRECIVKAETVQ